MSEPDPPVPEDDGEAISEVELTIDGMPFRIPATDMTGAELRHLTHPPIPGDRDIWAETDEGSDRRVANDETVSITDGMRVFTVPSQISAG